MVFTFSTKGSSPTDTESIKTIKQYCKANHINFSSLVVSLLQKWHEEKLANVKR